MKFSIIIPTRNNAQGLAATLFALSHVNYPPNKFEIVVVNNASSDETEKTVELLQSEFKNLIYLYEPKIGQSFSRNRGIRSAKNHHLIFIDDDITVGKDFLIGYRDAWTNNPEAQILGGKINVIIDDSPEINKIPDKYSWCFAKLDLGSGDKELTLLESLFSANMSCKKNISNSSIFNTKLGRKFFIFPIGAEDYELCQRTILSLQKIIYIGSDQVAVEHHISERRFKYYYLFFRHFFDGVQLFLMDSLLIFQYPEFFRFTFEARMLRDFSSLSFRKIFEPLNLVRCCGYFVAGPIFNFFYD